MSNVEAQDLERTEPRWRPIGRIERRVAGVLVEKAKTTPEAYPLSLNALVNGSNQKNNRDPQMQLEEADVSEALDNLKGMGAVAEIQGSGRVAKFRHLLYEWLGVDKVELAVMAELLLRGEQTIGELRGRAARMEPIADLPALQPILKSLIDKKLVLELTGGGRGTRNIGQIGTYGECIVIAVTSEYVDQRLLRPHILRGRWRARIGDGDRRALRPRSRI